MYKFRLANQLDINEITLLASAMHRESKYSRFPFAPDRFESLLAHLIENSNGIVIVCCHNSVIIGAIAGAVLEHYSAYFSAAYEYGMFVQPEYRGKGIGYRLAKRYISWAQSEGAQLIDMSITTGITEERTGKLYQRLGLKPFGTSYALLVEG